MRTVAIRLITLFVLVSGAFLNPVRIQAATPAKTVNVEIILDASGSMAERLDDGQTRIDAAKSVMTDVINELPIKDGVNVGLRIYGHKGTNTESGKAVSCQASELKVPIDGVDKAKLQTEVDAWQPIGWTPLALSLIESAKDFPKSDANTTNATVLVTDGLETCGGDPCSASRQIKNGPEGVITHVIGFALDETEQANLQCIVDESGGLLLGADDADQLSNALFQVLEELDVVQGKGTISIESIGGVFPKATIVQQPAAANDSTPTPADEKPFTATLSDSNSIEVPVGTYDVSWTNPSGTVTHVTVAVEANLTSYIRGSIFRFPHGGSEVYRFSASDGTIIWQGPVQFGDAVWVLPGVYRLQVTDLSGTPVLLSMDVQTLPGKVTEVTVTTAP